MSHATHFLERLARVERPEQLDLALALYRDAPLVKHVLSRVRLPEGAERVALNLGEAGPYVVVSRDGGFVTCLGEGMVADGLPVVARGHLDALARESEELRRRLDLAEEIAPGERGSSRLLRRFMEAGPCASREDFEAFCALRPVVRRHLTQVMCRTYLALHEGKSFYMRLAARPPQGLAPVHRENLLGAWRQVWSLGHFALLVGSAPHDDVEALVAENEGRTALALPEIIAGTRLEGVWQCGAWSLAKMGKPMLGPLKRYYRTADGLDALLALPLFFAAMGLRHRALRAEIVKALYPGDLEPAEAPDDQRYLERLKGNLTSWLPRFFEDAEKLRELGLQLGRKLYLQRVARLRPDSPYRFPRPEDVPDDLALAALAANETPVEEDNRDHALRLAQAVVLSGVRPEQLFFPADLARQLMDEDVEPIRRLVARGWTLQVPREPERAAPEPAPNERCPCGSGKKYKRCCQAKRAAGA